MGYKNPGKRDGTGPAKGSFQRKISKVGKKGGCSIIEESEEKVEVIK